MSGIYIPGMEMPTSCAECRFYGEYCYAKGDENKYSNLPCPLVPVPEHGRLIDADAELERLKHCMFPSNMVTTTAVGMYEEWLKNAPTIIPADKETEK